MCSDLKTGKRLRPGQARDAQSLRSRSVRYGKARTSNEMRESLSQSIKLKRLESVYRSKSSWLAEKPSKDG